MKPNQTWSRSCVHEVQLTSLRDLDTYLHVGMPTGTAADLEGSNINPISGPKTHVIASAIASYHQHLFANRSVNF